VAEVAEACRLASSGIDRIGVGRADLFPLGEGSDENLLNFARLKAVVLHSEFRQRKYTSKVDCIKKARHPIRATEY
jgi:hypothetical protein